METRWYAVYTKSRWERKVVEQLNKAGIENYCPLNKIVRQWSDRKKVVQEPLFTSYVFVKITERQISELRTVFGVVNLVYWLGKPAVIMDSEIEVIKDFLANHFNVSLERAPLNVHDKVKILNGPFTEMEGSVISVKKKTLKVLLPSLRFFMTAEIEIENVCKISTTADNRKRVALEG
jgi:transcription antitermination factor NusG